MIKFSPGFNISQSKWSGLTFGSISHQNKWSSLALVSISHPNRWSSLGLISIYNWSQWSSLALLSMSHHNKWFSLALVSISHQNKWSSFSLGFNYMTPLAIWDLSITFETPVMISLTYLYFALQLVEIVNRSEKK